MEAKRSFEYAHRRLSKGQAFDADNNLDAHVLEVVGHAARREPASLYRTRVMTAETAPKLDSMDVDALRAMAARLGLKVHHRAGPDKLRQAIRQAKP